MIVGNLILAAAGLVSALEHEDPKYLRDWYAPPPDWTPVASPSHYTANTRVSEIVWVEYKGSYGPGIRIQPISPYYLNMIVKEGISRVPEKDRAFRLERARQRVRTIADLVRDAHYLVARLLRDIGISVEHFADRRNGHTAFERHVFNGDCHTRLLVTKSVSM